MFSIRDFAFGIKPSGNSTPLRPPKLKMVSRRLSAKSLEAFLRSSSTSLMDSIPACIASLIAFILSAAFSASSTALAPPSSLLDASEYFFSSALRMSPNPRPSFRLSLILSMKPPIFSPASAAKSVFSANSSMVAERPTRNTLACSVLSAMPVTKEPTVRATSKSFTSCILSIMVSRAPDASFAPLTITSIIFAPLSCFPNSLTFAEKSFKKSLAFVRPFSTPAPIPTTPFIAFFAPLIIPSKASCPNPTILLGSATIPFFTESKALFTFLETSGINPNKFASPRTQPVKASNDEPRNFPIPTAIFSNMPNIPFPALEITSNTAKNISLAPFKRKLKPETSLIIPVITNAKVFRIPFTTKVITLIIALKTAFTTLKRIPWLSIRLIKASITNLTTFRVNCWKVIITSITNSKTLATTSAK